MTAGLATLMLGLLTEAECSSCVGTGQAFCPVCHGTRVELDSVSFRTMLRALPGCLTQWEAAEELLAAIEANQCPPDTHAQAQAVSALRVAKAKHQAVHT